MKSCLVLDDSSVIRKVARRILENIGCNVIDASSGHEALLMCRERLPDAIFVDWTMPGMSGIEFISSFKETFGAQAENTSLIYCTYEMDIAAMTRAKRAGATHFFMKPFDRKDMLKKLEEVGIYSISEAA
jgi:two-component system chemotaxis response regulator CheY